MKGRIGEARRIVIKIGSALLVDAASGTLYMREVRDILSL